MFWKRYFLYYYKGWSRRLTARIGGNPEEPLSSYFGRIKPHHKWVQILCYIISKVAKQELHCVTAIDMIDVNVSDPTGKYTLALLIFWLSYDAFLLGSAIFIIFGVLL